MAASYPSSVFAPPTITNGDTVDAADPTRGYDELTAIEQALLTDGLEHNLFPQSTADARTLGTASKSWGAAYVASVNLKDATTLTIAAGIVTATQGYHALDTEGAAATDDLDTITIAAPLQAGSIMTYRAANVARVVTLKDGTGNLLLNGDYALSATDRTITLLYDGTNLREIARSVQTASVITSVYAPIGGSLAAGVTAYLGPNTFNATESVAQGPMPFAVTLSNLQVAATVAPGGGQTQTFTVRKNGVDTTLTCVISGGAAVSASDTTHTVSFAAGDLFTIKAVASGGAVTATVSGAVKVTA